MTREASIGELLTQHRDELVREAYLGILGREADPEGLANHGAALAAGGRLAPVLDAMVQSEEAWRRLLAQRAGELTGAVFRALLGREPEDEARAAYGDLLGRTGDLQAVLAEVAGSAEHEQRVLDRHGVAPTSAPASAAGGAGRGGHEAVVRAVFQGLLGRAPDEQALAAYTRLLDETGDVAAFIAEVDRSPEHRRRMLLARGGA